MFHDARNFLESRSDTARVGEESEIAINEVITLIRKAGLAGIGLLRSPDRLTAQSHDFVHDPRHGKRRDFQGNRATAELRNAFGRIGDHQEMPRCPSQDFFTQQCATGAFDQAEIRGDLVSAVDGKVNANSATRLRNRYPELFGARGGLQRRGEGLDSQFSTANRFGDKADKIAGRRSASQAEKHAIANVAKSSLSHGLFFFFDLPAWF